MIKDSMSWKHKTVGFFPLFYNLAETGRAVLIAEQFRKRGGKIVFFSHGGKYEYLAKQHHFDIIPVDPLYSDEFIDLLWKSSRLDTLKNPFTVDILRTHVEEEKKAFHQADVDLVVSTNNWPCRISAPAANIPLIFVTPKVVARFNSFPEDADFFLSFLLPKRLKLAFLNWYAPRSKMYVKSFAKVAKQYGVEPPRYTSDINHGDFTFYTNSAELLREDAIDRSSGERLVGPISLEPLFQDNKTQYDKEEQASIETHIKTDKKTILLTFGSSGTKELFLHLIQALQDTRYRVVAIYANLLDEKDIPQCTDNILLKRFVPSIARINKRVDLAITHGGEGTVLTAAYSGKPVIGFPMQFEQHLNLEMLVKQGSAVIAEKKNISKQKILDMIEMMFLNYDRYYVNAKRLAASLPPPTGHKKAAELIETLLRTGTIE